MKTNSCVVDPGPVIGTGIMTYGSVAEAITVPQRTYADRNVARCSGVVEQRAVTHGNVVTTAHVAKERKVTDGGVEWAGGVVKERFESRGRVVSASLV